MKKYISIIVLSFIIFSCKKQTEKQMVPPSWQNGHFEGNVNAYLRTNLSPSDYSDVDTANIYLSNEGTYFFARLAIAGKKIERDFILVQADSSGNCTAGRFVHIRRDSTNMKTFTGKVSTESLQHDNAVYKKVTENAVQVLSCGSVAEESLEADDDCDIIPSYNCEGCLPEVVVIGYVGGGGGSSGGGISYFDYLNLLELAGGTSSGASSGVYSPVSTGGSSPSAATTAGALIKSLPNVTLNFETSYGKPSIDVNAFMKCFSEIPDAGATCSITVYSDLPVNDNPQYIFNILTGATGHAFLSMTKTNGSQSVTQYFGKTTSKAIAVLGFPVAGKIVDNTAHKYNATLTMSLTPGQLQTAINKVVSIGNTPQYDMWENNCVDYALSILNTVRPTNPLNVGMSIDPSTGDEYQTPQSLYIALQNLKNQNGPDAPNITMDVIKNAGASHGACN
ncbi:MAG TPA: hypothetical protein VMT76_01705 [Puia sp.]|nr:hypothetical protein [Puia sp.]